MLFQPLVSSHYCILLMSSRNLSFSAMLSTITSWTKWTKALFIQRTWLHVSIIDIAFMSKLTCITLIALTNEEEFTDLLLVICNSVNELARNSFDTCSFLVMHTHDWL